MNALDVPTIWLMSYKSIKCDDATLAKPKKMYNNNTSITNTYFSWDKKKKSFMCRVDENMICLSHMKK